MWKVSKDIIYSYKILSILYMTVGAWAVGVMFSLILSKPHTYPHLPTYNTHERTHSIT